MDYLNNLNPHQKEAVTAPLGPVIVVAGAGTGENLVLTKRFEYLVKEHNISPERILVISSTLEGTKNIRKILQPIIQDKVTYISTFQQFAKTLLDKTGHHYSICYPNEYRQIIRDIVEQQLDLPIKCHRRIAEIIMKLKRISKIEERSFTKEDLIRVIGAISNLSEEQILSKFPFDYIKEIYDRYCENLDAIGKIDLDDLLMEANKKLNYEILRRGWDNQFQAILFDEFQDIDEVQFDIIKKISQDIQNIFCVGDPDQSIYGFRGVVSAPFDKFHTHFGEKVQTYKLNKNYRSTPEILSAANSIIAKDKSEFSHEDLTTDNPSGSKVQLIICNSKKSSDQKALNKILEISKEKNIPLGKFAILFRNGNYSNLLINKLFQQKIPFVTRDLYEFWESEEIEDLIAWLTIAFEQDKKSIDTAIRKLISKPRFRISKEKQKELKMVAWDNGITLREAINSDTSENVFDFWCVLKEIRTIGNNSTLDMERKTNEILERSGFWKQLMKRSNSKYERVKLMINDAFRNQTGTALERIEKQKKDFSDTTKKEDKLYIGTIHGAKEIAFDYVFLMGFDEGLFPAENSINPIRSWDKEARLQEERRLAYVAFTRAVKELFLFSSSGESKISRIIEPIMEQFEITRDLTEEKEEQEFIFDPEINDESRSWTQPDLFFECEDLMKQDDPFEGQE